MYKVTAKTATRFGRLLNGYPRSARKWFARKNVRSNLARAISFAESR